MDSPVKQAFDYANQERPESSPPTSLKSPRPNCWTRITSWPPLRAEGCCWPAGWSSTAPVRAGGIPVRRVPRLRHSREWQRPPGRNEKTDRPPHRPTIRDLAERGCSSERWSSWPANSAARSPMSPRRESSRSGSPAQSGSRLDDRKRSMYGFHGHFSIADGRWSSAAPFGRAWSMAARP